VNLLTEKTFGGTKFEGVFTKILQLNDTTFYIAAATNSSDGDITYNPWPASIGNYWLLQINHKGDILWNRVCGGSYTESTRDAVVANDGDVSGLHDPPGNSENSSDIWVFEIDKTGNLLWQKCLGGTNNDYARNIFTTTDGGYMIVGSTRSSDGDVTGYYDTHGWSDNIWFAKIDSTVGIKELHPETEEFVRVYPNPVNSELSVELLTNTPANRTLIELYDMHGKRVATRRTESKINRIDMTGLKKGLYLVKIQNKNKVITKKVVKER